MQGIVDSGVGLEGGADLGVVAAETVIEHGGDVGTLLVIPDGLLFNDGGQCDDLTEAVLGVLDIRQQIAADTGLEVGEQAIQRRDGVLLVEELVGIREEVALQPGDAAQILVIHKGVVEHMVLGGLRQVLHIGHVAVGQQLDGLLHGVALRDGDLHRLGHRGALLHGVDDAVVVHVGVELVAAGLDGVLGVEEGAGDDEQQLIFDDARLLQLGGDLPHGVALFDLHRGGERCLVQGAHVIDYEPTQSRQQAGGQHHTGAVDGPETGPAHFLALLALSLLAAHLVGVPAGGLVVFAVCHRSLFLSLSHFPQRKSDRTRYLPGRWGIE